jgi:adenine phosphoribosyltransferase
MIEPFEDVAPSHIAAIESRGFILGAPLAVSMGIPFVPIRKAGKLPRSVRRISYALEYGTGVLEVHDDALGAGSRVLIVDDVLATGGTALAAGELLHGLGAQVAGYSFLVALDVLGGRARLGDARVSSVLAFT